MKTEQTYENKVALLFIYSGLAAAVVGLVLAFGGANGAATFLTVAAGTCGIIAVAMLNTR